MEKEDVTKDMYFRMILFGQNMNNLVFSIRQYFGILDSYKNKQTKICKGLFLIQTERYFVVMPLLRYCKICHMLSLLIMFVLNTKESGYVLSDTDFRGEYKHLK